MSLTVVLILLILACIKINIIYGCGSSSNSCFGWKTSDISSADSGSDIDVRFLVKNGDKYNWTPYTNDLDNDNCDDQEKGVTDWYDAVKCPENIVAVGLRMDKGSDEWNCDALYVDGITIDTFYDGNNNNYDGIWVDYGSDPVANSHAYYAIDMNGNILSNDESFELTSNPTNTPAIFTTKSPSNIPSITPTNVPSAAPSNIPSTTPSKIPSTTPSKIPSTSSSNIPSTTPSKIPSTSPSKIPTITPSNLPSINPTNIPTDLPTLYPTEYPTQLPSKYPIRIPTNIITSMTINSTQLITNAPTKRTTNNFFSKWDNVDFRILMIIIGSAILIFVCMIFCLIIFCLIKKQKQLTKEVQILKTLNSKMSIMSKSDKTDERIIPLPILSNNEGNNDNNKVINNEGLNTNVTGLPKLNNNDNITQQHIRIDNKITSGYNNDIEQSIGSTKSDDLYPENDYNDKQTTSQGPL